jgi:hypothetical protein
VSSTGRRKFDTRIQAFYPLKKLLVASLLICAVRVSDTCGSVIDENAFTAPIHLELSPFPLPFSQPVQPAGAQHLELARMHESAGRTTEALAEYAKAADSDNAPTRGKALAESEKLLGWRNRLEDWAWERLDFIRVVVFNLAIALVLFLLGGKLASLVGYLVRICRPTTGPPRLEIEPLSYWPTERSYTHFREIVIWARAQMSEQDRLKRQLNITQEETILPTILNTLVSAWEVPFSLVSDKAWPVLLALYRKVNPPDYTLEGSLSFHDENYHVVFRLEKKGETSQIWERPIAKGNLTNGLKALAHEILAWIVKRGSK